MKRTLRENDTRGLKKLKALTTPVKIQDFLDSLPINYELTGETCRSPIQVLHDRTAHCLEGALLAAAALWLHGESPLILHLKTVPKDDAHAVALYKRNGYWGAISKTNHAALRFRDPVYKSVREVAASYFHEYFINATGAKTLRAYAGPIDLSRFGTKWLTGEKDLWTIADALEDAKHIRVFPLENKKYLRPADRTERRGGTIIEWKRNGRRA